MTGILAGCIAILVLITIVVGVTWGTMPACAVAAAAVFGFVAGHILDRGIR